MRSHAPLRQTPPLQSENVRLLRAAAGASRLPSPLNPATNASWRSIVHDDDASVTQSELGWADLVGMRAG